MLSNQQLIESIVQSNSNNEAVINEGLALFAAKTILKSGDVAAAYNLLQQIATPDPDNQAEFVALALQVAKALKKSKTIADANTKAEQLLQTATTLDPYQGGAALAQHYKQLKRYPEAINLWREAIKTHPQDSNLYLNLARLYEQLEQPELCYATYMELIAVNPTHPNYLNISESLKNLNLNSLPNRPIKIGLVGSATLDHLQAYLRVECYRAGLSPLFYQGGYDQYTQDLLNPQSELYAFEPEVLICAIQPGRLFPNLTNAPFGMTAEQWQNEIERGISTVQNLLDTFAARSSALVLLHNMPLPDYPALGIYDWRDPNSQAIAFSQINQRLAELARSRYKNVFILDEDKVQARVGKSRVTDPRYYFHARMVWSEAILPALAHEYLRFLKPYKAMGRKCIVLDLDNTLWGGVIGEDGLSGIQVGSEAPGNAFVAFQQELLKLSQRGILLAIASKNNPEDAEVVFEQHPDMVLKLANFAARRINWQPKEHNLTELAQELNIGLDALVFLDDNPVERAKVRATLPAVLVPEMPTDPAYYVRTLLSLDVFDPLTLTEEDRNRNQMYAEQRARQEFEDKLTSNSGSLEDYLAALDIVVEIDPSNDLTLPRIAQLTGKTNQFNLTTIRRSEAQIIELQQKGYQVYTIRVLDKFGDNGLTGVAIVSPTTNKAGVPTREIDTLLLSCRVLGRGVETALLAYVAQEAHQAGVTNLEGWFLPTAKNAPAKDCYARHAFSLAEEQADGKQLWRFNLAESSIPVPVWLKVKTPALL